jgi:cell division septation protein DedD
MRLLVFLLIFANLLFFAYSQGYFGQNASPDAQRLAKQINPERLTVLERSGEQIAELPPPEAPLPQETSQPAAAPEVASSVPSVPAPAPLPVASPPPPVTACALFNAAAADDLQPVSDQARLAGLHANLATHRDTTWWVFIPPAANRQAAIRKTGELLALGISEYFIMPEGPQQFAISLGVFSQEEAARNYLATLRDKGVRSARMSARHTEDSSSGATLTVRGDAIALMGLRANLPGGVSSRECP